MSIGPPQYEEFTGFTPLSELGPHRAADDDKLSEGERYQLPGLLEIEIDLAAFWAKIEKRLPKS